MDYYEEKVRKFLEPYLAIFREIIVDAWNEYHKSCDESIGKKLQPLGRAIIMNNLVVANAKIAFDGKPNIQINPNGHGTIITILSSEEENFKIFLRFKKLGKKYQTYNHVSARNEKFTTQLSFFSSLPETINLMNLNAGYKFDETWNSIEVWITCPNGRTTIAWKFQVGEEEQYGSLAEETIEIPPISPELDGKRVEPTIKEIPAEKKRIQTRLTND